MSKVFKSIYSLQNDRKSFQKRNIGLTSMPRRSRKHKKRLRRKIERMMRILIARMKRLN